MHNYFLYLLTLFSLGLIAQNDLDAIRYSRSGINGTSRFTAMGGAFGALGADLSCAAYNPAGLGIYKKGEAGFSGGLKFTTNQGLINGNYSTVRDANFVFNNIGVSFALPSPTDPQSRHVFAFTNTQLQNFSNKSTLSNYTNSNSIAKDMLNIASTKNVKDLNSSYEGLGYNVYILDTFQGKFFSFVDLKRTVSQTRNIVTAGKQNELNFSYAYSYKDKFYIGASIGIPKISYTSTTSHSESDNKDSMRVTQTTATSTNSPATYSNTYIDGLPGIYPDKLGFNSLTYTEYFSTSGSGVNLKIGAIARVTDYFRIGMHYHTPSLYTLKDVYYNSIQATYDKNKTDALTDKDPPNGGYYNYKIITPAKVGLSTAFIINKKCAIGLEYEIVNYKTAQLSSGNVSDFAGVNAVIRNKYSYGSNVRAGVEFNLKPVMLRGGYNMQGSPFGNSFEGKFVRQTVSLGVGFRTKNNVSFDFVWYKTFSSENYYMFTTINQQSTINYNSSMLAATVGIKFN
jgi:hypothetical protein